MVTNISKRHQQRFACCSALAALVLLAATPAEARRIRMGGTKSAVVRPVPVPASALRASSTDKDNKEPRYRQLMPSRVESARADATPPVAQREEAPVGPRSAVPVLGASGPVQPAPAGFAVLN